MDPKEEIVDPRTPPEHLVSKQTSLARLKDFAERSVGEVTDVKESSARGIALIITWTFAVCAVLLLVGLYLILERHPTDSEALLVKTTVPALKEAGSFLSTVFGPLLAFVLGYYFGERKSKERS